MRIGYLIQPGLKNFQKLPYSGPVIHVREVISALQERGHDVVLVARMEGAIQKTSNLVDYEAVTVPWFDQGVLRLMESAIRRLQSEFQLPYFYLFDSLHFAAACAQVLKDCDVLYERMSWGCYGGVLAARWLGNSLILEANGDPLAMMDLVGNAPKGLQRKIETSLTRKILHQSAHVVASGEGWKRRFVEHWGLLPKTITVVENGTSLVEHLQRDQLKAFQNQASEALETGLVYLGGFYPWHGIDIFFRALANARERGIRGRATLIGSGPGQDEARRLAAALELDGLVTFTGALSMAEYAPLLAKADIGVSPYCGWHEYSGLKLFDYKAAGLASIASGVDGQPATLTHLKTGWIVPPCDEEALTEAIVRLSLDKELRITMGKAARVEAENRHSWKHTAANLEKVLLTFCGD